MAYQHPLVPPKGPGVFHIPRRLVDEMLEAAGLNPMWVREMHLYAGRGEIALSVPFTDLADPLVDAAGFEPDGYVSNHDKIEQVFGARTWHRSSEKPDYTGTVEVYVVGKETR